MENGASQAVRIIPYAGDALGVLGECSGLAVCQMTVPAGFAGPPPHVHYDFHYDFDEAIYVLSGTLTMSAAATIHAPRWPAPSSSRHEALGTPSPILTTSRHRSWSYGAQVAVPVWVPALLLVQVVVWFIGSSDRLEARSRSCCWPSCWVRSA